ncbi:MULTISPECIES: tetratricopeptide repeat protein [unclassified Rickettsia]|uniref:tetratricopeptide repeat protein n=1 Tax=unclassified Rickettsia TaxID=114295 RepID=UPI0031330D7D
MKEKRNVIADTDQYKIAVEMCSKLIAKKKIHSEVIGKGGESIFNLKTYKEGISTFMEALKLDSENAETLKEKEESIKREAIDAYDKTIAFLESAIKQKQNAEYYNVQGNELYNSGRYEEAIIVFDEAIGLKPHAMYYYNKGNALHSLEKNEEALIAYEKAVELKPDYAEAYDGKGNVLQSLGKNKEAIKLYDKAISLKEDYAESYSNKGNALFHLRKYDEALEAYNKAIELKPKFTGAIFNKKQVLYYLANKKDMPGKAIDFLKKIIKSDQWVKR